MVDLMYINNEVSNLQSIHEVGSEHCNGYILVLADEALNEAEDWPDLPCSGHRSFIFCCLCISSCWILI